VAGALVVCVGVLVFPLGRWASSWRDDDADEWLAQPLPVVEA